MASTSTDFSLDGSEWDLDDTTQDLLNDANVSNYRSKDIDVSMDVSRTPKRSISKGKASSSFSTTTASFGGKRGHDKTEGEIKTATTPKRAGRKPLEKSQLPEMPSDPRQKRKEQNRAAQRAFRERKERHVSELQERIRELEEENASHSDLVEENLVLKEQVKKLKEENYALKGTAFTFEYPPKSLSHDEEYRSSNSSSGDSSSGSLSISESADKVSSSSNSSVKSRESFALASAGDTPEEDYHPTPQDLQSTAMPYHAMLNTTDDLLIPGTDTHNFNFFNPSPIGGDFANSTLSSATNKLPEQQYLQQQVTPVTTPSQRSDLIFTDYRIPPTTDGFLFQNDSELPPLFGEELDLFGFSAPAPFMTAVAADGFDSGVLGGQQQQDLLAQLAEPNILLHTTQDEQTQALLQQFQKQQQGNTSHHQGDCAGSLESLMETLHQAQREPRNATEIAQEVKAYCPDFDLDELCSDLKKKVTCSDSVFTPKEVNVIIDYFQRKKEGKYPLLHKQQQQQQQK